MELVILRVLEDNFCYLLLDRGCACAVDPGEAGPVVDYLTTHEQQLNLILNTHHHADHCAGNAALKAAYGCPIWGGSRQVPNVERVLTDGEALEWRDHRFRVLTTPGHTHDSLCFYWPREGWLFTGDTLFPGGCGRLFDGTAQELWQSFQKILALPDDTAIYSGHNYGLENLRFASHFLPEDAAVRNRLQAWQESAGENRLFMPSTLEQEKHSNIFLRARDTADLALWRERKNHF